MMANNQIKESQLSDADIMDAHLRIERYKNRVVPVLNYIIKVLANSYHRSAFVGYLINCLESWTNSITLAEVKLRIAAYPHMNTKLNTDQMDELFEAYRGKNTSDWDNENTSYRKMYLS